MVFLAIIAVPAKAQPQPSMYTLDNIYYYLTEGTEATWGAHSLEPQSGVPGEDTPGFTKSLEDIYYYMAAAFGQTTLTPDKVFKGEYFFCVDSNYWGVQEGTIPTPTPPPTPPPPTPTPVDYEWYQDYGPSGTGEVVQISNMYVASWKEYTGCAFNGTMYWADACSYASGLNWLEKTDWQVVTREQLITICNDKGSLASYYAGRYWSSTAGSTAWNVHFYNCSTRSDALTSSFFVRAVRFVE